MSTSRFAACSLTGAALACASFASAQTSTNIITFDSASPTDGFFEAAADPASILTPTDDGLEIFIPSLVGTGASFGGGPETNFAIAAFGNTGLGVDGTILGTPNSPDFLPAVPAEGQDTLEVVVRVLEGNDSDFFNINVFEQAVIDSPDFGTPGELDGDDFIRVFTYEFDITGVGDEFVALQVPLIDGFQTDFVGGFNLFGAFFGVGDPALQVPDFSEGTGQVEIQTDFFSDTALAIEVQSISFVDPDGVVIIDVQEGDFSGDGIVDQADLDAVLLNFGVDTSVELPSQFTNPDFLPDGVVDQAELDSVLLNFGAGVGSSTAVPEPATLSLLALGGIAMMRRRK